MPAVAPAERRFTVEEYHAMARAGILTEDDRVELLEGRIVTMSPIGSRHAEVVRRLTELFILRAREHAIVSAQNPVRLDRHSEPEPDLALLVRKEAYAARHPRPDEVLLLIEVAASTLAFDLREKVPLYARAGIGEVWVVALDEERVHVFRRPSPAGYEAHETRELGEEIEIEALPEVGRFAVADLLGA